MKGRSRRRRNGGSGCYGKSSSKLGAVDACEDIPEFVILEEMIVDGMEELNDRGATAGEWEERRRRVIGLLADFELAVAKAAGSSAMAETAVIGAQRIRRKLEALVSPWS